MLEQKKQSKPILIYFNTRGVAQIIRCVLLEIQVEFEQVFVGFNGYIDPKINQQYKIDIKSLPYFIHNGFKVQGTFPIVKYICNFWNRNDLLGKNIKDNVIINQIMTKQIRSKGVMLNLFLKGLKQIYISKSGKEGIEKLKEKIVQIAQDQKLVQPVRLMFKSTGQFLCGYLTILDFTYYDRVFYGVNFYGAEFPQLKVVKQYLDFFEKTQFFKKHSKKLCEYKIVLPELAYELNYILKQMWLGDPKYISPN